MSILLSRNTFGKRWEVYLISNLTQAVTDQGVVVVERVSSLLLGPVHKLCGGDLLSSPSPRTLRHCELGVVSAISKLQVLGQW